ncbi:hypothetical protein PF049_01115 [Erythrobacteraceae bacterium WH01K]|nr:hypothetical protein PF049_01115 [Erythrobacteraceae bacterium WH01K]
MNTYPKVGTGNQACLEIRKNLARIANLARLRQPNLHTPHAQSLPEIDQWGFCAGQAMLDSGHGHA